jgi:hypothetical protein
MVGIVSWKVSLGPLLEGDALVELSYGHEKIMLQDQASF